MKRSDRVLHDNRATIVALLATGATITLSDGRYLKGDPESGYIELGGPLGSLGVYDLSEKGLHDCVHDREWSDVARETDYDYEAPRGPLSFEESPAFGSTFEPIQRRKKRPW